MGNSHPSSPQAAMRSLKPSPRGNDCSSALRASSRTPAHGSCATQASRRRAVMERRRSGNSMRPSRQMRNATGSSSTMSSRRSRKGARRSSSPMHRLHSGKTEVRIFDYVDREVPMLSRMFEKRLRGYRVIGYAKGETPLGYGETGDEVVVEYDEDVLRSLKELDDFT